MFNRLKKFKKDKKGSMAIEIVVGMFMLLMIFSFITDVALISMKFYVVSQENGYLARTAMKQGGLLDSAPTGYPGGDTAYVDIDEMQTRIETDFAKVGIEAEDIEFSLSAYEADYQEPITTNIAVSYKWSLISNFIPGDVTNEVSSTRTVMSEYKYHYDDFVGE